VTVKATQGTAAGQGSAPDVFFQAKGYCPACEKKTTFVSKTRNFRGGLICRRCRSVPRERALAEVLIQRRPDWRRLRIHESSPAPRGVSMHLKANCRSYLATNFYPDVAPGKIHDGYRCENLEALSFAEGAFYLHIHLDVMEHVNHPDRCVREMMRTLAPGGMAIFTTPVEATLEKSRRVARYTRDGVEHLERPEYHGNPAIKGGSLVTFKYGKDLADLIRGWEPGFEVEVINHERPDIAVLGPYLDMFVLTKSGPQAGPRKMGFWQRLGFR
jgi:SAM-dependent methyltransferase